MYTSAFIYIYIYIYIHTRIHNTYVLYTESASLAALLADLDDGLADVLAELARLLADLADVAAEDEKHCLDEIILGPHEPTPPPPRPVEYI